MGKVRSADVPVKAKGYVMYSLFYASVVDDVSGLPGMVAGVAPVSQSVVDIVGAPRRYVSTARRS